VLDAIKGSAQYADIEILLKRINMHRPSSVKIFAQFPCILFSFNKRRVSKHQETALNRSGGLQITRTFEEQEKCIQVLMFQQQKPQFVNVDQSGFFSGYLLLDLHIMAPIARRLRHFGN
jgi:hypothetical protein